jgi:hypothetical protein
MTEEVPSDEGRSTPTVGRTWADVLVGGSYVAAGLLFIAGVLGVAYFALGRVPQWIFISIGASLAFVPFLMERAKDDSRLFIVLDGPGRLTEYRIGKRVPMEIEGGGVRFTSKSATERVLLTEFDEEARWGRGSLLSECSQLDQVRDLTTVQRLSTALEDTLREERLTLQHVGIEVEKKNREIVDWALRLIYEGTVPTEITEALGIDAIEEPDMALSEDLEAVLDG